VDLYVGRGEALVRAKERPRIAGADRERALAPEGVAHADPEPAHHRIDLVVDRDRPRALEHHPDLQMVLEILADAGAFGNDRNAVLLQQSTRADARELQELRRVDGPAGENDLSPRPNLEARAAAAVLHADSLATLEDDACRERLGDDLEVRTAARPPEIPTCRAPADAAP
jgi:hypothetical protein